MPFKIITVWSFRCIATLVMFVSVVAAGTIVYFSTPRSFTYISEQVERTINGITDAFTIRSGETVIQWDGWRKGIAAHIKGLSVQDGNGHELAHIPDVAVKLDVIQLAMGRIVFKNVIFRDSRIELGAEATPDETPIDTQQIIQNALQDITSQTTFPIRSILFENLTLYRQEEQKEVSFTLSKAQVKFITLNQQLTLRAEVKGNYADVPFSINSGGFIEKDTQFIHLNVDFKAISPAMLVDMTNVLPWMRDIGVMRVSGQSDIRIRPNGIVDMADVTLATMENYPPPKAPRELLHNIALTLNVKVDMSEYAGEDGTTRPMPFVKGKLEAKNVPMEAIASFWPKSYEPYARQWVTERIKGGTYNTLTADLNLAPKDFVEVNLAEEALKVAITYKNGVVQFDDKVQPITHAQGTATFNPNYLEVQVEKGQFADSHLDGAVVSIKDLGDPIMQLGVKGPLRGNVKDLLTLSTLISNTNTPLVEGQEDLAANSDVQIDFTMPIGPEMGDYNPTLGLEGALNNFVLNNAYKHHAMQAESLTLQIKDKTLNVSGPVTLAAYPLQLDYSKKFDAISTRTQLSGTLPREAAALFLATEIPAEYLQGNAGVNLAIITEPSQPVTTEISLDLTSATLAMPMLEYTKKSGEAASLSFILKEHTVDNVTMHDIAFTAPSLTLKGTGALTGEALSQTQLNFTDVLWKNQPAQLNITHNNTATNISLKADKLDIQPLIRDYHNSKPSQKKSAFTFQADIRNAIGMYDIPLLNFKANAEHNGKHWVSAEASGSFDKTTGYKSKLTPAGVFTFSSNNAGTFLRAFDVTDNLVGGVMEINAETKNDEGRTTKGSFRIDNYNIIKASILARILTLGSFTGVLDLLNGKGISFEQGKGEFLWRDNLLSILWFRMNGSALGMTMNGDVTMPQKTLDMGGAIIPAYTLNSLLGKVPLVGNLLVGNKGEGLIATRFTVKGTTAEPDVFVNPLSALTPGFLRKIWGEKDRPENIPDFRKDVKVE